MEVSLSHSAGVYCLVHPKIYANTQVVEAQIKALRSATVSATRGSTAGSRSAEASVNGEGVFKCFEFASPSNKAFTGPAHNFGEKMPI